MNRTDVHILGGNHQTIETQYEAASQILRCNFKTKLDPLILSDPSKKLIVERKADMIKPRQAFGLCAVNNFIYVAGGTS